MYIKELKLVNFKSFAGSSNIFEFSPHINYFVGNNNAGKTTILEALNFVCNGPDRATPIENYMSLHAPAVDANDAGHNDNYYVEITLAGDIKECIDRSVDLNASQKTNLKNHVFGPDDKPDKQYLKGRRYFDDKQHSRHIWLLQNPDTGEYKNSTGIDGAFQNICSPTLFRATDTPDAILDFSPTKMLGKIMATQTKKFTQSDVWKEFQAAHRKAFLEEGGYESYLHNLERELSVFTSQQFGNGDIKISFSFDNPDATTFIKMGKTQVDDGVEKTDLKQKGNGLQRAVALAVIRLYADILASQQQEQGSSIGLFLCVDEPEIWMHPKAQEQLAQALSVIGNNEQIWITTHSPYILSQYDGNKDKLSILNDLTSSEMPFTKRVVESTELGGLHKGQPSLAEITYRAFQMATPEFHSELFGLLQSKTGKGYIEPNEKSSQDSLDE